MDTQRNQGGVGRVLTRHVGLKPDLRTENWPEKLLEQVELARVEPFSWGAHDCCTFAADCVLAMTGVDPMENFRGRYSTAAGAVKAGAKAGHATLADLWSAALPEISPSLAGRGDVVMFWSCVPPFAKGGLGGISVSDRELAIGVVTGHQAAAAGPDGLAWAPMDLWLRAWRV